MKKHLTGIILVLLLGTFSWGQGAKESFFDVKKSREELEIMKGIINTTLRFAAQKTQSDSWRWRFSNINTVYLAGQGAVFMIPLPDPRLHVLTSNFEFAEMTDRLEKLKSGYLTFVAPAPPAPPAPVVTPAPPAAPAPKPEVDREELKKAVEAELTKVKKSREEAAANREKFLQNLSEVKTYLLEVLANYGDSMTTVKPDEYINLVLVTDGMDDQKTRADVISARKSWIADYKGGRLNLEGFKQKVVQYNQ